MAGGGKFGNGAVTAAFGYLFNACALGKMGCTAIGGAIGTLVGVGAAGACDWASGGACVAIDGPIIGSLAAAGAATGAFMDAWIDNPANDNIKVHANSNDYRGNIEVYHLYDKGSSELVKIGTSIETSGRYTQAELTAMNANYVVVERYTWRYVAYLHEFIELRAYKSLHGSYPKYNFSGR